MAAAALEKSSDDFGTASIVMIAIAVISLILAIVLGFIISGALSRPLNRLVIAADKLALGDVDFTEKASSTDEVGELVVTEPMP